ncbi:ankyrin repeat and SAM domain-containing protein 1A [Trichonephila clavipes]|nr:ankyrin repeat and SAM domain-containing protein 1A [Trichonephila clavipes]
MFENTGDPRIVATVMDIRITRSISELTCVSSIVAPKDPCSAWFLCSRANAEKKIKRIEGDVFELIYLLHPLQEIRNKRVSRDIETLTEDELFATIDSVGHIRVSLRRENKSVSVSTDNIEEVIDDDPFAESVKPAEIIRCMQAQYGDSCLWRSKIYQWIERFKQGRTSKCFEERLSSPSTSTS